MKLTHAPSFLFLILAAAKVFQPELERSVKCYDGLYMIFARASGELPGKGYMGYELAPKLKRAISHSGSAAVQYPAAIAVSRYNDSVSHGTQNMIKMVERYVDNCPNHVVALFGYSQGAQVVGDTICGSIESNLKTSDRLRPKYEKQILAVIQMGDPSFIPRLPWDVGNSTRHGEFPRKGARRACGAYSTRIQSYCDQHDFACASGKSVYVHLTYLLTYQHDVLQFVEKQWNFYQKTGVTSVSSKKDEKINHGSSIFNSADSNSILWALIILSGVFSF